MNDINAYDTLTWNDGNGLEPIGNNLNRFAGSLNGNNFVIINLYINRSDTNNVGLFGFINANGQIYDLGLVDVNIMGYNSVGGLAGYILGDLNNVYSTGYIYGNDSVGGLVGTNSNSIINSYFSGTVIGEVYVGGLVGENLGVVSSSYSDVNVNGYRIIGGLVGYTSANIIDCYSIGDVNGDNTIGGLVGNLGGDANIINSYSVSSVTGNSFVGGLIGFIELGNTYTSFYDTNISNLDDNDGRGYPKTTIEMQTRSTFSNADWDFSIWGINSNDNNSYPFLRWQGYTTVDLSPTDIVVTPTTAGTSTITCDINNLSVDENATEDYNVLLYIEDSLIDFELVTSDLLVEDQNTFSFSHTFTAGTYDINCVVDYNLTDMNSENDNYHESVTITSAVVVVNSPGGGSSGGSGASTEITKPIVIDGNSGKATFSNNDFDGVDKVILNYETKTDETLTLKLDEDPSLTSPDFKIISGHEVIKYMTLTYSGDQNKLDNAEIIFSLLKSKVVDKTTIKLARLHDGVWTYYVPKNIDDKETYYQFTFEVPGFSYFAIVKFKETIINNDTNIIVDNNIVVNDTIIKTINDANNNDINYDVNDPVLTPGTGAKMDLTSLYWIIGVVVVLVLIVWGYIFFRNKPKTKEFSFKDNDIKPEVPKQPSI
jgi:PGF-pre-PGF domain-containing protein